MHWQARARRNFRRTLTSKLIHFGHEEQTVMLNHYYYVLPRPPTIFAGICLNPVRSSSGRVRSRPGTLYLTPVPLIVTIGRIIFLL